MAMDDKYSSTAVEILAEGMENTWSLCIASEIPRIIFDIFLQIEHVNGASAKPSHGSDTFLEIQVSLVELLLPSLAMADVPAFLHVIERQIWSIASDSPFHIVSLMSLIRVTHDSPRNLAPYLDKVAHNPAVTPTSSIEFRGANGETSYSLKTSTELLKVLNRIWSLEEQHAANINLIRALKRKLDMSRAKIKELAHNWQSDWHEMEHLMKQITKD
uniref:Transducin/WD40 repeat-like superfamily protein n=1 Tax=Tanacetum cinerariifolium TaxID=118510 RepID=A0A6L2J082_TANCI|nr:transducin/WD40 repeat-like superfamily protein [Tanacetum cinerariifolium]